MVMQKIKDFFAGLEMDEAAPAAPRLWQSLLPRGPGAARCGWCGFTGCRSCCPGGTCPGC